MHGNLKSDLITGFLEREDSRIKWKQQLRVYCHIEKVINGNIDGHFDFLEREKIIEIGNYEVLKTMFKYVDVTALKVIDNASKKINRALKNNKNES